MRNSEELRSRLGLGLGLGLALALALTLALALALTLPYQVRGGVRAAPPRQEAGHRRRGRFSQAQRSLRGALRPERALTLQVAEGAARPECEGLQRSQGRGWHWEYALTLTLTIAEELLS